MPPRAEVEGPRPKAVVEQPLHHFGILDPLEECAHEFVIRNAGQGVLRLRRGPTTCKCTMSDLRQGKVPPGGRAVVRVSSKTENEPGPFSHGATIFTNDPTQKVVQLQIHGVVRTLLGARPPEVALSTCRRNEPSSARFFLYSQTWDDFEVAEVLASREDLRWQLAPADDATLAELEARCAYRVDVTVPAGMPAGYFREWLKLSARPDTGAEPRTVELPITGRVPERLRVYGRRLANGKLLQIGAISAGQGAKEQLTLRIYDEHQALVVRKVETRPEFLRVKVTRCGTGPSSSGLYKIDVEVPPDAPAYNAMPPQPGQVRIETDHPHVPVITLDVEFAVLSPS
jgi:hypothetical protein